MVSVINNNKKHKHNNNNIIKLTKKQSLQLQKKLSINLQNLENFNKKTKLYKPYNNININKYENQVYDGHNKYIDGIDVIYWINLDRSIDRKTKMIKVLSNFNIKNIRIEASDGKLESDENIYGKFITDKFIMTKIEYSCLLSHLNTIKEFANSNYETALIFEDDISLEFSIYWNKPISKIISEAPKDWEIIMLGYLNNENIKDLYTKNTIQNTIVSAFSYIINKKSAYKLINNIYKNNKYYLTSKFKHQSDHFLYRMLKTYCYKYSYFTYANNNITTIHDSQLPFEYSKKSTIYEWKNYIYENVLINNIYNYTIDKNNKNFIEEEQIIVNEYGLYAKYYYKNKTHINLYYITKNNKQNDYIYFIYIFNKLKLNNKIVIFKENIVTKSNLIKEISKVKKLTFLLNYINKN